MSDQVQEAPVAEVVAETKVKVKTAKTGNLILDTAAEIEGLTKQKALNEIEKLGDQIDTQFFRLGGVLKVIHSNSWFEGFESFGAFIEEKFGFAERKAQYYMRIYTHLVDKQIPWEKVAPLGWTKLKELVSGDPPVLTLENVDEWVAKAQPLTVKELIAMLAVEKGGGGGTQATSTDTVKIVFKLKPDQGETVNAALAKGKAELGTEFDNVALEGICAGYLAGTTAGVSAPAQSLAELFKTHGYETVLTTFGEVFPNINVEVTV